MSKTTPAVRPTNGSLSEYEKQIARLIGEGKQIDCIQETVDEAIQNLQKNRGTPFIIYGQPQSGKTEMMICLTARLLDAGEKTVIHLISDNLELLEQNLDRFRDSGIIPLPRNCREFTNAQIANQGTSKVLFCKKNKLDLKNLLGSFNHFSQVTIIDDEADHASPNGKVRSGGKTEINKLIEQLIGKNGAYIGVTATPARNNLNETFGNCPNKWVYFKPHKNYFGQDKFFPLDRRYGYILTYLGGSDEKLDFRAAVIRFLISVARQNTGLSRSVTANLVSRILNRVRYPAIKFARWFLRWKKPSKNFSMLIHTSGSIDAHKVDRRHLDEILEILRDPSTEDYKVMMDDILANCGDELLNYEKRRILKFIRTNSLETKPLMLNSSGSSGKSKDAQNPPKVFTFIIGGNIVSRGLTLNNLLSMYFTRETKAKMQQDTYIQRARMFGNRGKYFSDFNLTVPEELFLMWHDCFFCHGLSLKEARMGKQPVWWGNNKLNPVAAGSVVAGSIFIKLNGAMFSDFAYQPRVVEKLLGEAKKGRIISLEELQELSGDFGADALPDYITSYISNSTESSKIAFYPPHNINKRMTEKIANGDNFSIVYRRQGFWGQFQRDLKEGKQFNHLSSATHHFRLFFNNQGRARLMYKIKSPDEKTLGQLGDKANVTHLN